MRRLLALILLLLPLTVHAVIPTYAFETPAQEERFRALTQQLRCLVCQGESIADSNAELAADLRQEVHRLITEGKSDEEVIGFLTARYGDFVLFRPPVKTSTWPLWFGPLVLLVVGGSSLIVLIRRRQAQPPAQLSPAERERLDALLREERR